MATNTYVALDKVTVGTATSSITFSSIPQGYTDLVLVLSAATTHTLSTFPMVQFNGDTATNYSVTELYGTGSAAGSARDTNTSSGWIGFDIAMSTTVGEHTTIANFMNYSNSTTYKTWLSRANRASSALDYQGTDAVVGLWRSTAAITSMTIKNRRGGVDYNFAVGTTASLYGIAASSVAAKATGGAIYADSTYYYHVFSGSGTFTPNQALTADCLIIAGGGGGGGAGGGGGGAGGFRTLTSQSLNSGTGYTVTVGAAGAAGSSTTRGGSGSTSTFNTTNASGGGGGGTYSAATGLSGGSGGGAAGNPDNTAGGSGNSGGYSPVEGYAGGNGRTDDATYRTAGGGGGATAAGASGQNTSPYNSGNGGAGSSAYSSWATATGTGVSGAYAGGGGGGGNSSGGAGGGGGSSAGVGVAATANTGSGGGGGGGGIAGAAGGSGIVIVRYAK